MRLDFINVRKGKKVGGGGGREREKKAIKSTTLIT